MAEMDQEERLKWKYLLKTTRFFAPFTDKELDEFLQYGQGRKYRMHEYIIKENTPADAFSIILKGKVNVVKESALKSKTQISTLEAGYVIGEIAMLLNEKRTATIIAGSETFIFSIDSGKIDSISITAQAKLYKQLAVYLAKKLKSLSTASAEQLIGLAEWYRGSGKYGSQEE